MRKVVTATAALHDTSKDRAIFYVGSVIGCYLSLPTKIIRRVLRAMRMLHQFDNGHEMMIYVCKRFSARYLCWNYSCVLSTCQRARLNTGNHAEHDQRRSC